MHFEECEMSKKSAVVSGFGFAMQIGAMIEAARQKLEVSDEDFHVLGTPEGQEYIERMVAGLKPQVPEAVCFDPVAFFQTRPGLCVWDNFISRIVKHTKIVEVGVVITPQSLDLKEFASDSETLEKLSTVIVFDGETEFCPMLANMINRQSHGETGLLQNNSSVNIFYVRASSNIHAVLVRWQAGIAEWYVNAWTLDDHGWHDGGRVFCRN
jgi:hypothetical protein